MELRFQFVFLLSCIFCISSIDRSVSLPSLVNLGIAPEDENYYKGLSSGAINCKDGSKKFTKAQLNDDFCDCPDGSDEPGTSACPSGKFYCKNAGHAPLFIYSSRVNDGICDCCDGSDEHDGKVKCPNTCWEVGRVARDKLKKKIATFQEGITIRKKEIEEAKLAIAKEETEVSKLKNEQKILKGRVEQLQDKKEQIEKVEEEERLKREKEEKERKEADDAKLEASKVEEKTEVHEEAVKSDIHDKIGLLEDYPPLKDVVEGHDKAADEEQHGDHSVKDEFPVDEVEQAPEDSSQHPEVKEESSTNNNKADVSSRNVEKDAAENIESLSKEELGRVIGSRWLGKRVNRKLCQLGLVQIVTTYVLQVKDQIGSFFYFPSLAMHKAAGGYGGIIIRSRPLIPVPFPPPTGDYTILVGDWFKLNHTDLKAILDGGNDLPFPDGLLVNGRGSNGLTFTVDQGRTYRFRISNVGLTTAINFRIQGHKMVLVEAEGTHTLQNTYESLDIHLGQSYSVLVTMDQPGQDYYIVASTRFTSPVLTATSILHYSNSAGGVSGPPPGGPTIEIDWSLNQARSIRQNLTASGPRPNPQGSYHYGLVNTTRTIRLANSAPMINGKKRYAVNSVSFIPADTPLKLADYFKIPGVFNLGSIQDYPTGGGGYLQTSVMAADFRAYVEVVFENPEDTVQSWHIDGHIFFVVGMDGGQWSAASRLNYNLRDGISRCTIQVYPRSWTALYMPLDNVGMWNIRSENWARQYIGQQFYLRVYSPVNSWRDEYPIPIGALLCGRASGRKTRPL